MAPGRGLLLRFVAVGLAVLGACAGCQRERVLRLTYQVDVGAAYDGEKNAEEVMRRARDRIVWRLDEVLGRRSESVSTRGNDLLVDLAALPSEGLLEVESLIASPGRCEFKMVDERGSERVFLSPSGNVDLIDEGIEMLQQPAPDGVDANGNKVTVNSFYARMACRPSKHPTESLEQCLGRFKAWTSTLEVPGDHEIGFEAVTEAIPGTDPPQFRQVAWRTFYLSSRTEMANEAIRDVSIGREQQNSGNYYVQLSFSAAGAQRFEEVTGANVNRRFAILLNGVVESAPFIKQKIGGGAAMITMGAGDPEKQLHDAKQFALVVLSGALPAPMHLLAEERLRPGPGNQ
jgi:preprotein translocase subunit SecD